MPAEHCGWQINTAQPLGRSASFRRAQALVRREWGEAEYAAPVEFALAVNHAWILGAMRLPTSMLPTLVGARRMTASAIIRAMLREYGL